VHFPLHNAACAYTFITLHLSFSRTPLLLSDQVISQHHIARVTQLTPCHHHHHLHYPHHLHPPFVNPSSSQKTKHPSWTPNPHHRATPPSSPSSFRPSSPRKVPQPSAHPSTTLARPSLLRHRLQPPALQQSQRITSTSTTTIAITPAAAYPRQRLSSYSFSS
jgi:hypothetical protein